MERIENALGDMVESIIEWLPLLLAALVLLLVGSFIARWVSTLVRSGLAKLNFDTRVHSAVGGTTIQRAVPDPSGLTASMVYWLLMLGVVSLSATVLGIEALNDLIYAIYGFIPTLLVAIIIFLVGSALAAGVAGLVNRTMGDTPTGKLVETIVPVTIIGITMFMILDQLGVAPVIVTITYAALLGSVALGSAIAFGLGGRDVASRLLDDAYDKGKDLSTQAKKDFAVGKKRAQTEVRKRSRR